MNSTSEIADLKDFFQNVNSYSSVAPEIQRPTVAQQENPIQIPGKNQMWGVSGNCFFPCREAAKILPPGYFSGQCGPQGFYLVQQNINHDSLLQFPDSMSDKVINEIKEFWKKEKHFRSFGFMWKRGFLLYGPPGSGKSCTVNIVCREHVNNGGVVFYVENPQLASECLKLIRTIEPNRSLIVVLEDIDALTAGFGETNLLSLLDGEHQVDNVVFIATTNYPEKLDYRIVNRPSRFDFIAKIGMPNEAARRIYLADKSKILSENEEMLQDWVDATENFSFAHLKELIISVEVFERPFNTTLERLKCMMQCAASSMEYSPQKSVEMGFLSQKSVEKAKMNLCNR